MKGDHIVTDPKKEASDEREHSGEHAVDIVAYNDLSRRDVRALIFYLLYAAESFDYQESVTALVDNFNRGFDLDIPLESEVVSVAQKIIKTVRKSG